MSDEGEAIVRRIRSYLREDDWPIPTRDIFQDAIDEIERLEEANEQLEDAWDRGAMINSGLRERIRVLEAALRKCLAELAATDRHVPSDSWRHGIREAVELGHEALEGK